MKNIVVGVDPSATAKRAALKAASLAADSGATLHLVTCVKPGAAVKVGVGSDTFTSDPVTEAETFLTNLKHELPHDKITSAVMAGDPAKAICDEAQRVAADMIVVGNRRVQGVSRVLGSIASDVARHSPCDVLIANTTHE